MYICPNFLPFGISKRRWVIKFGFQKSWCTVLECLSMHGGCWSTAFLSVFPSGISIPSTWVFGVVRVLRQSAGVTTGGWSMSLQMWACCIYWQPFWRALHNWCFSCALSSRHTSSRLCKVVAPHTFKQCCTIVWPYWCQTFLYKRMESFSSLVLFMSVGRVEWETDRCIDMASAVI